MVVVLTDEAKRLTEAWGLVMVSLCYCFCVGRLVNKGVKRLILMAPVMILFFLVPLHLTTVHTIGTTGFFISWLANFKLYLFAFGNGPLSSPNLSLPIFLLISCFPIKVQQLVVDNEPKPKPHSAREGSLFYLVKALLLLLVIQSFRYIHLLPNKAVLLLYGFNMYFSLDLILAVTAYLVRAGSSLELEPQFNEPYLATSLQDFWGKRWNLMVSEILRPTVYEPMLRLPVLPKKWAYAPAALATFVVSGIMHELIFFYMGRLRPSWRLMSFFLLHGVCIMAEISLKKAIRRRWRLPTIVARTLTILFVFTTGILLFFPEFQRCKIDQKAFAEYAAAGMFFKKSVVGYSR
ncbi:Wax synthase domain-containing protein [Hirschfeldia incana]|nr:Wax synthase domain-containing protein [Hirschfeldia incana]